MLLGVDRIRLNLLGSSMRGIELPYRDKRLLRCSEFTDTAIRGKLIAACEVFVEPRLLALQTIAQDRTSGGDDVALQVPLLVERLLLGVAYPELDFVSLLHALPDLRLRKALLVGLGEMVCSDPLLCG